MTRKLDRSRLVIATHNAGKLKEIGALLAPFGIECVSAGALGLPEPEETGTTFVENAVLKARAAAEAARCTDFIAALPSGYDTIVGERGTNLSGGQRQRIGIARAFLKDARIVLLDEATSALDTGSELAVQQGLDALMSGRTVLAVAHRLSTVVAFDRIIVVEDGRIVEDGGFDELLRRGGRFAALARAQGLDPAGAGGAAA